MPVEDGMVGKIRALARRMRTSGKREKVNFKKPAVDTVTNHLAVLVTGL